MVKIAISGAAGRMGRAIVQELERSGEMEIVAGLEYSGSNEIGKDLGSVAGIENLGVVIADDISNLAFDILIDFSIPEAVLEHLDLCKSGNAGIVLGTTGLDDNQNQQVAAVANHIPVLFAANTSVGVNLCASLVEMASNVIGHQTDIEIVEAHHRQKVDAPSGTALLLGEAAATALGKDLSSCGVFSREGHTGARKPGTIGFSTIRGGDIAGEHTVMFIGDSERIEITHRATDRKIFARGGHSGGTMVGRTEKGSI